MLKKNMFIANIKEIDDDFIGILCLDKPELKRFAEDNFGNYAIIEKDGSIVAYMLDYEKEEYKLASSIDDFYKKYHLYDIDEVYDILNKKRVVTNKENPVLIELYKAKAIVGKDFIDLDFATPDGFYNATEAFINKKINEEEFNKMKVFYPCFLKEAKQINKGKLKMKAQNEKTKN